MRYPATTHKNRTLPQLGRFLFSVLLSLQEEDGTNPTIISPLVLQVLRELFHCFRESFTSCHVVKDDEAGTPFLLHQISKVRITFSSYLILIFSRALIKIYKVDFFSAEMCTPIFFSPQLLTFRPGAFSSLSGLAGSPPPIVQFGWAPLPRLSSAVLAVSQIELGFARRGHQL